MPDADTQDRRTRASEATVSNRLDSQTVLVKAYRTRKAKAYHMPDPDDPSRPRCQFKSVDTEWDTKQPNQTPIRTELCDYCEEIINAQEE